MVEKIDALVLNGTMNNRPHTITITAERLRTLGAKGGVELTEAEAAKWLAELIDYYRSAKEQNREPVNFGPVMSLLIGAAKRYRRWRDSR